MEIQLVVAAGSKAGQVIPITGTKFIIGRADDCHLKPRSELISRYHCAIISENGYVAIRDLGSKNGVYLNEEKVATEHEIKNGDRLRVGHLDFFVHITVEIKAPKKSKVESVSDAVTRTVEIQSASARTGDDQEAEIADWLLAAGESDEDQETQTIDASDLIAQLQQQAAAQQKPEEQSSGTGPKKHDAGSSRDAAANLLKSFFKGGR
jgi:pSer/pThr/pTyr-binding forkhead associated (FHA) protein